MAGGALKTNYKPRQALCQLSFEDLNIIGNVLNTIGVTMAQAGTLAEFKRTNASGKDWQIVFPSSGLPTQPATGDYVLTSQNGVLGWIAMSTFTCPQ